MEALYSKLYDKYSKLKVKKDSEIDIICRDQEVKFMNYVSAADELIEHLRNDNERLHAQINELRNEVASIRSTKDEQCAEYQKLFMEENQMNKKLSEEIQRLLTLQQGEFSSNAGKDIVNIGPQETPGSSQVKSDTSNGLAVRRTRKRSRYDGAEGVHSTPSTIAQHGCAQVREMESDLSKQTISSQTALDMDLAECCRKRSGVSGGVSTGLANCIFQHLIEYLVGMKLFITQTSGICVSAIHQSSGYSFSLTWVNETGGEEVELQYRVLSLGTFERVAPEWMREVIVFSTRMCPIFFERLCRVIKLHG